MTDTGVASLADALRTNNTLEELHIAYSIIHEEGALHIADILRNARISKLSLDCDPIGDKGLKIIFEALKHNTTLKQLGVFRCGMGDAGVASLADALRTNKTLEELFIHQNDAITEDGMICFVEAVSRHPGLGDVRIVPSPNHTSIKDRGRLEVYLNGEWGTFYIKNVDGYSDIGFNSYAADAACRQLGYQDSWTVSKASDSIDDIPLASNSTPIHTGRSVCTDGGFSHVLRCFYLDTDRDIMDSALDSACTHDDDVIIKCSILDLHWDGYDTELILNSEALNSTYPSSGILEIFSSYSSQSGAGFWGWSNICGTKFDQNAANTACIQLGYTGALSYYTTSANRSRERIYTDIWLDGVTCGENDYYICLDSYFCYPQTLAAVPCNLNNVIASTCTFDLAKQYAPFGDRDFCEKEQKTFCALDMPSPGIPTTSFIIVSAVLSTVIVLLSLVVVGLMVMMWNRRGRAQYQTVN